MKLSVKERVGIIQVLPAQGDINTLLTVRDIKGKVLLTKKEQEKAGITDNGTRWTNNFETDVKLTEQEKQLIKDRFETLNANGQIPNDALEAALKFNSNGKE